jgi:hypothetical protein
MPKCKAFEQNMRRYYLFRYCGNKSNCLNRFESGTTEFTFNKRSAQIEERSIQISGLKNTSIVSINYGINYFSKQKQSDFISD